MTVGALALEQPGEPDFREYWVVHPEERIVTIYRRTDGQRTFEAAAVGEARGEMRSHVLPELAVSWDGVFAS